MALAALAIALIPQAEAQNTNHTPGTVISWGDQVIPHIAAETRFTKIAAGYDHSLALKSDGTIVAWGRNDHGQSSVPAGLNGVVAIAAGYFHNLALKSDGTVVAWGDNTSGQSTVPGGLNGVAAIAAGSDHGLALKSDGTVVGWGAWGLNDFGQSSVPGGLNGAVAIAAGNYHSLALITGTNQKPFILGAPQRTSDGSFRWTLFGEAGRNYTMQSSTNLTLWTDLQTVALVGSSVQITDTNAPAYPRRFYRVRTQ